MARINQDGFFDIDLSAQLLPQELEGLFNEGGWKTYAKYRSVAQLGTDPYRKTFAETYLFSSKGSDNKTRNFGFTVGYGGKTTAYSDAPIISKDTSLGELLESEGTTKGKVFHFPVFPIYPGSVVLYDESDTVIRPSDVPFMIDGEKGTLTFGSAQTGKYRATYALTDNAPDLVKRLYFFTYESMAAVKLITRQSDPLLSQLTDQTGGVFKFPAMREGVRIKEFSYTLYETISGIEIIPPTEYTVDHEAGTVKFNDTEPTNVFADYEIEYVKDAKGSYGDIKVSAFDPTKGKSLMGAAYDALKFIFPSLPTAVSFIPTQELGLGWGRDAQIYFWGNITKDRVVSYFRFDPAPDATAPFFAPLYIGRLSTIGKAPRANNVIIGGCRPEDEIPYEAGIKLGRTSVDYGVNTSNGNSSVLLQGTVGGAMNQKHYLAFITHDAEIDPTGEGRFNPSAYSSKNHIAPMYIVHPSDGYVGRLDEVYAIHPKNISQLDELEIEEISNVEHIGNGDGKKDTFHVFHKPVIDGDLVIKIVNDEGCKELTKDNHVEGTPASGQFTITDDKKVILGDIPKDGDEIYATYRYNQVYRFTMADTPRTPYRLANTTPYAPIGLGFLKENI